MKKMKKVIIGVVGKKLSGKGTFGMFLRETCVGKHVVLMGFSDILRDTLRDWDIPETRHNLQRLAIFMNHEFGEGTLARAVKRRLVRIDADIVVIDGVRWLSDRDMLRKIRGCMMVYVTANISYRFDRRLAGQKTGEASVSREQFLIEEQAEPEQYIEEIGMSADATIENNGTPEEFRTKVQKFCEKFQLLGPVD
ncbi:MAG: Uncharacterized protein G01um101448_1059 [Parcubacteria group bacterium Gr01-1014_48]|nr:MAG: Uncharacterized protein Greene041614_616 [Parcubacteria group bacterium Greene0416_14]TSC71993.1 MAG: Uncharacterized protein G01um101448_1059 [Parcubacteria group bacterium Gr01-1014_48]